MSNIVFQIRADKIAIDGDYLQLEGLLFLDKREQQVRAVYYLKSEAEQKQWLSYTEGITIKVSGGLDRPSAQTNLNGFDYQHSLRSRRINQILTIEQIHSSTVQRVPWYSFGTHLANFRKNLLRYCDERFLPATAAYVQILLLGERGSDPELIDTFNQLGIVHLFSLSGMHVVFFFQLFRFCALKLGLTVERWFWVQLVLSLAFGGLTGFPISVIRALLQMNISACSRQYQLHFSALDCWGLALFLGVMLQPFALFTLGGRFSYMLSFSILFIGIALNEIEQLMLQQLCFSIILSLFTLPLLAVSSYEWQPIGIFLTFLLLPFFERVLLPGVSVLFASSFLLKIRLIDFIVEQLLQYMNGLFQWLNKMNFFSVRIGQIPLWLFFSELLLILFSLIYLGKNWKRAIFFLTVLLLLVNQKYFLQKGLIAYIDVGQGDSILVQAPFHGETILIDTGGKLEFSKEDWRVRENKRSNADYTVIPFLKSRGIGTLDKVFITHADADHMGDLLTISKKVFVKQVYFPKGAEQDAYFVSVIREMSESGTIFSPILAGEQIDSSFQLTILAPSSKGQGANNDSLVIHTKVSGTDFLFTGDLEEVGETELLRNYPRLPVDILKVGHHGSRTSTSKAFIEQIKPKQAIISNGRDNRYGHPHPETLTTLSENNVRVFQTAENGMIYYEWLPFIPLSEAKTILDSD